MKMAMVVNDLATEQAVYTTTRLAVAAIDGGHEVWYVGTGDLAYDPDDVLRARAWRPPEKVGQLEDFFDGVLDAERERITVDDLDVLLLRNDPAEDVPDRGWAQTAGVVFGDLIARSGVLVLNDPAGLSRALTKLYLQRFPADVRPAAMITRDADDVREFVEAHGGKAVLKPLQGSGGQGVFIVQPEDDVNLKQMVEAVSRDGYAIVQEYVPAATEGDTRVFLIDGEPLRHDGAYAAFRRIPAPGEARSNMRVGAGVEPAEVDDRILRIVDAVRDQLVEDGMFLVGLDIVGDCLIEVNVFSPGGLGSVEAMTGVDFAPIVVEAIERKLRDSQTATARRGTRSR
jgi:glutathione synthase